MSAGRKKIILAIFFLMVIGLLFLADNFSEVRKNIKQFKRSVEYGKTIESGLKFYTPEKIANLEIDSYYFLKKIEDFKIGKNDLDFSRFEKDYSGDPFERILNKNKFGDGISFVHNIENKQEEFSPEKVRNYSYYLTTGDFYTINKRGDSFVSPYDDVMLRALYCDVKGYDEVDFSYLKVLKKEKGDYVDTHLLMALVFLRENNCFGQNEIENEISKISKSIIEAENKDKIFSDLYAERVVVLYWAGKGDLVQKKWLDLIKENYDKEFFGWRNAENGPILAHTTGLSLLALAYFVEGENKQTIF